MRSWKAALQLSERNTKLLITDWEGHDVLKASLSRPSQHPRAVLTLLEGVALFSGHRLDVAYSVDANCPSWREMGVFGDELWPAESQLVDFHVVHRAHRRVRLGGMGDFRRLRQSGGER